MFNNLDRFSITLIIFKLYVFENLSLLTYLSVLPDSFNILRL